MSPSRKAIVVDLDKHPHLTKRQLAQYWGVSVRTIERDIRKKVLPVYRLPGGALRIKREDALSYGRPVE